MMRKRTAMLLALGCVACGVATASPRISNVKLSQDCGARLNIDYTVDADAVVTFDVLTNGVSIGRTLLETFTGDFGVVSGGARRISWDTRKFWPDRKAGDMTAEVKAWSLDSPPDYMIVDLVHSNVNWYASESDIPGGTVLRDEYKTTKLVLRRIHARGIPWRMGRKSSESTDGYDSYQVPHEVVLTNDYYMGVFELTQKQYKLVRGLSGDQSGPFAFKGYDKNPAESVAHSVLRGEEPTYDFASKGRKVKVGTFFDNLRTIGGGLCFDLPTSAQWEYACRAGTGTAFNHGIDGSCSEVAWYKDNWSNDPAVSSNMTHEVGLKQPNGWGLYDMHGNVWEWCVDVVTGATEWYQALEEPAGPAGTVYGSSIWRCGGCYMHSLNLARSASRIGFTSWQTDKGLGLRVWCGCPCMKPEE